MTITVLTDFGTRDGYVAAMKGVLRSELPDVHVDDAGHEVPRGDVRAGAWALEAYWLLHPPGTVHLVVVDPGVGTARRGIAVASRERFLVGPDNGVLSPALRLEGWRAVALRPPRVGTSSRTFHGRDLFAPAATRLARGEPLEALGEPVDDPVALYDPEPVSEGRWTRGEVVHVDRFGNLVTNLPGGLLEGVEALELDGRRIPVGGTYGDVGPGTPLALVDSFRRIEVACRDASAEEILGAGRGSEVRVPLAGGSTAG